MPESFMSTSYGLIKLSIDPSTVRSSESLFNPVLTFPLKYTLQMQAGSEGAAYCHIYGCEARLKAYNSLLSICTNFPDRQLYFGSDNNTVLEFPLDRVRVEKLETLRKEGIDFSINVHFKFAVFNELKVNPNTTIPVATKLAWAQADIQLTLTQSDWIELLPGLGHEPFRLVEIPGANLVIGSEYDESLTELEQANIYLLKADFDKVVLHCRSALEPIRKRFPDLKNFVKTGLSSEWIDTANSATLEWLDKIFKFQSDVTSKTHHVPSIGHYSRQEAQAIYMLTVATVSIAGTLEPIKTKK